VALFHNIRLSRGQDAADVDRVQGERQRSLPTLQQLPWFCDPDAMNGSLLCGIKADVATLEALNTAFRQNFGNVSPCNNEQPAQHRRDTSRAGERTQTMGGLLGSQERTKEPPRRNPVMPFISSGLHL
jgi:hypothetical protein